MSSSVLLVDDNSVLLSALSEDLSWRVPSLHVDTEPSSLKALGLLRHQPYHALITDLQMPELDGKALLAAAKTLSDELPVIMITASPDLDLARRVLDAGAFDFLAKHLLEELAEAVKAALRWHDMTQQHAHVREALRQVTARQQELDTAYLARDRSHVDAILHRETRELLTSSQRQTEHSFEQGRRTRDRLKSMIVRYEKLLARQAALTIELRETAYRTALSRFSSR
jgi:DNA-binding NtrC family response regulator